MPPRFMLPGTTRLRRDERANPGTPPRACLRVRPPACSRCAPEGGSRSVPQPSPTPLDHRFEAIKLVVAVVRRLKDEHFAVLASKAGMHNRTAESPSSLSPRGSGQKSLQRFAFV